MKHYDSFENINNDKSLLGQEIWAFNKLDGQNFCAVYNPKKKEFQGFGSKNCNVDESSEQFGGTIKFFKSNIESVLCQVINKNIDKGKIFHGAEEITFYFEWYGEHSFAGFHQEGDEMHLALIDANIKKKGYIQPSDFYDLFCDIEILETPKIIYIGKLTEDFIKSIYDNDWRNKDCKYPDVKEGVVCKNSVLLKGQRLPKVKIKTKWWLDEVHAKFSQDKWKDLE